MKSKRINSFHAHSSAINCLKIGPKSGKVLVTGGHDKLVNLWAIGRAVPILVFVFLMKKSLAGHVTPVECVALDWPEEFVVAGSSGGNLKLWDLEEQKVCGNLL
jgi:katanin p80 WD40 repeat-containing subunit B1